MAHNLHDALNFLSQEMGVVLSTTIVRLGVAAVLGGLIGLERELRHKPAGLRTNMFICFGAAMFTVLSDELAAGFGGDHTRIAAQIIPGIGFIGAGSILHARGSVTGLTTAATLFVAASVGMAAGAGLYITAIFATALILIALVALGHFERRFSLKHQAVTYEVTGDTAETLLKQVNRVLDEQRLAMRDVHAASSAAQARVVFTVVGDEREHVELNIHLHECEEFAHVSSLGVAERE